VIELDQEKVDRTNPMLGGVMTSLKVKTKENLFKNALEQHKERNRRHSKV